MTALYAIMPIIILACAAAAILLLLAFYRNHALTVIVTVISLAIALAWLVFSPAPADPAISSDAIGGIGGLALLHVDGLARFFGGMILGQGIVLSLLAHGYFRRQDVMADEFYVLLLLAALGCVVLAASVHFATFFLGLETLTIALYVMIAYHRYGRLSIEAAFKYLVLAAVAAGMLLFGMAMVFADANTMEFSRIASAVAGAKAPSFIMLSGLVMILIGIAFKLALVPLHLWTADVYQGAPAPVTALIATISKGAMFVLLLRLVTLLDIRQANLRPLAIGLAVLAIASMAGGNLLALLQRNVKRLLAYSSISHLGYVLVALLAGGAWAVSSATYYVLAYFVTITAAFGVVAVLSGKDRDADAIEDYQGLAYRRPGLAGAMALSLLSLAGLPVTAGFIAKFYLVGAGIQAGQWLLVASLIATSAIGLYFYLRVIAAMYMAAPARRAEPGQAEPLWATAAAAPSAAIFVLVLLTTLLLYLGLMPGPIVQVIQALVGSLS